MVRLTVLLISVSLTENMLTVSLTENMFAVSLTENLSSVSLTESLPFGAPIIIQISLIFLFWFFFVQCQKTLTFSDPWRSHTSRRELIPHASSSRPSAQTHINVRNYMCTLLC